MKMTVVDGKLKMSSTIPMYLPAVEVPRRMTTMGMDTMMTCICRMMSVKIHDDSVKVSSTSLVFQAIIHVSTVGMATTTPKRGTYRRIESESHWPMLSPVTSSTSDLTQCRGS